MAVAELWLNLAMYHCPSAFEGELVLKGASSGKKVRMTPVQLMTEFAANSPLHGDTMEARYMQLIQLVKIYRPKVMMLQEFDGASELWKRLMAAYLPGFKVHNKDSTAILVYDPHDDSNKVTLLSRMTETHHLRTDASSGRKLDEFAREVVKLQAKLDTLANANADEAQVKAAEKKLLDATKYLELCEKVLTPTINDGTYTHVFDEVRSAKETEASRRTARQNTLLSFFDHKRSKWARAIVDSENRATAVSIDGTIFVSLHCTRPPDPMLDDNGVDRRHAVMNEG